MKVGKKELFWNYSATFMKLSSNIIILPLILSNFSPEYIGVWNVFTLTASIIVLFDFGYSIIFTQNLTFVFSGLQSLDKIGINHNNKSASINYKLVNDIISSMKILYKKMSIYLFIILAVFGSLYIRYIIQNTTIDKTEVYISWSILIILNSFLFYSFYFEPLLISVGKIIEAKKITIFGQLIYISFALLMFSIYKSLISICIAQLISIIFIRLTSYYQFFTPEMTKTLNENQSNNHKETLKIIGHNSKKLGLTNLGGFLVQRSPFYVGGFYLSMSELASYGLTIQILFLLMSISSLYLSTKIPLVAKFRIDNNISSIKKIYYNNVLIIITLYFLCFIFLFFLGNFFLTLIGSSTFLIEPKYLILGFIVSFLEAILSSSAMILQTKNDVPFYKASLISGVFIIVGIYISFDLFDLGLLSMFLAPLIVDIVYQAWKWPFEVFKDFNQVKKYNNDFNSTSML